MNGDGVNIASRHQERTKRKNELFDRRGWQRKRRKRSYNADVDPQIKRVLASKFTQSPSRGSARSTGPRRPTIRSRSRTSSVWPISMPEPRK